MEEPLVADEEILRYLDAVWAEGTEDYAQIKKSFSEGYTQVQLESYIDFAIRYFDPEFVNSLFRFVVGILGYKTKEKEKDEMYFPLEADDVKFGERFLEKVGNASKLQLDIGAPLVMKTLCIYKPLFNNLIKEGEISKAFKMYDKTFNYVLSKGIIFSLERCFSELEQFWFEDCGISHIETKGTDESQI